MKTKSLLLATTLLLPLSSYAGDWEINAGHSKIQHSWTDDQGTTRYLPEMWSVGINHYWDNGWGVGYMYGELDETSDSAGAYPLVNIDFTHIHGFEVSYRKQLTDHLTVFGGVGTYLIPMDHIWYDENGKVVGGKEDRDDDEGYFFGVDIKMYKDLHLRYKYSHYSDIDEWKEYIRGHGVYVVYKF